MLIQFTVTQQPSRICRSIEAMKAQIIHLKIKAMELTNLGLAFLITFYGLYAVYFLVMTIIWLLWEHDDTLLGFAFGIFSKWEGMFNLKDFIWLFFVIVSIVLTFFGIVYLVTGTLN